MPGGAKAPGERHSKERAALRPLSAVLGDPFPLVRYYAKAALSKINGAPCPVDVEEDAPKVEKDARVWVDGVLEKDGKSR